MRQTRFRRLSVAMIAMFVVGACIGIAWEYRQRTSYPAFFSETFQSAGSWDHWVFTRYWRTRDIWADTSSSPGIAVDAQTMGPWGTDRDRATADWTVGATPFRLGFRVDIDAMRNQEYFEAGCAIVLSTKPPTEMVKGDLCLVFHIHYAGIRLAAWDGWFLDSQAIQLTPSTGGGDNLETVSWHMMLAENFSLFGGIGRTPSNEVEFYLASDLLPETVPWYSQTFVLPEAFRDVPLNHLTVQRVPVLPKHFGYPGFSLAAKVRALQAMPWTPGRDFQQIFPAELCQVRTREAIALLSSPERRNGHTCLLWSDAEYGSYRNRWHDEKFANYRRVIESAANDGQLLPMLLVSEFSDDDIVRSNLLVKTREMCRARGAIDFDVLDWTEVAIVFDTLRDSLDPSDYSLVLGYLQFVLDSYLLSKDEWFFNARHNPSNTVAISHAGGGIVALVLKDHDPRAKEAAKLARARLTDFVAKTIRSDGGYIEGGLYWEFAISNYLRFMDLWRRSKLDPTKDALDSPLQKQGDYIRAMLDSRGELHPFNDTQPLPYGAGIMAFIDREYGDPLLRWLVDRYSKGEGFRYPELAFLWCTEQPVPERFPGVQRLAVLPELQVATLRSDESFRPGVSVGITGTKGRLSHHLQSDQGSVVIDVRGERCVIDPGYYQPAADAHSVVGIEFDGELWMPKGGLESEIVGYGKEGSSSWFAMDVTNTYADSSGQKCDAIDSVVRSLVMMDDVLLVIDDVRVESKGKDCSIVRRWQLAGEPTIEDAEVWSLRLRDGGGVRVFQRSFEGGLEGTFGTVVPTAFETEGPRDFGQSWIYRRMAENWDLAWYTVSEKVSLKSKATSHVVMVSAFQGIVGGVGGDGGLEIVFDVQQGIGMVKMLSRDWKLERKGGQWAVASSE